MDKVQKSQIKLKFVVWDIGLDILKYLINFELLELNLFLKLLLNNN